MPDVWIQFAEEPDTPQDLILTPHFDAGACVLTDHLHRRLGAQAPPAHLMHNGSSVVARLTLESLIVDALPLTPWWRKRIAPLLKTMPELRRELLKAPHTPCGFEREGWRSDALWLIRIIEAIATRSKSTLPRPGPTGGLDLLREADAKPTQPRDGRDDNEPILPSLWRVDRNRLASTSLDRSRLTVKADAVDRLFEVDCSPIRWAIIDSGIDATHPAFRRREASGKPKSLGPGSRPLDRTRIRATYDFTRLRAIPTSPNPDDGPEIAAMRSELAQGAPVDWNRLARLLEVPHGPGYRPPVNEHGTHVAGILTGDWRAGEKGRPNGPDLRGVAPGVEVYDLRVFDDDGKADEFTVLSALQFVRHLNARQDYVVVHGVNLSMSLHHAVANYACGRTPVCDESNRVVSAGTVVVAAAGNYGYGRFQNHLDNEVEGFRALSITDPGNAEGVITVGSTHRHQPHAYGVSFFSSRGPTGDGRSKPDLVAPGEKITAPVPDGAAKELDGTSQAAPHVSGAAALLMARYPELIGDPARIKQVLMDSCTDLGRRRDFQGAGALDVLRALQAI
ncbi:S8 family peptidase [Miltoncostaea oceani]|uniref:S8 family peptidase n=1 Tax=Miltoncostaea oceani TaxID=2843216 RepID=UPI001FE5F4DB|nr:S8 family peptidase [Miltoncostaea oceani]